MSRPPRPPRAKLIRSNAPVLGQLQLLIQDLNCAHCRHPQSVHTLPIKEGKTHDACERARCPCLHFIEE